MQTDAVSHSAAGQTVRIEQDCDQCGVVIGSVPTMLTRTGGREAPEVQTGSLELTAAAGTALRPTATTSGERREAQVGKETKHGLCY